MFLNLTKVTTCLYKIKAVVKASMLEVILTLGSYLKLCSYILPCVAKLRPSLALHPHRSSPPLTGSIPSSSVSTATGVTFRLSSSRNQPTHHCYTPRGWRGIHRHGDSCWPMPATGTSFGEVKETHDKDWYDRGSQENWNGSDTLLWFAHVSLFL